MNKGILTNIIDCIAPSIANHRDCKVLREKIKCCMVCEKPSEQTPLENWTVDELNDLYESEKERKAKFEDKAKTNIIGITISVTLIMGAYTLLDNIENKYSMGWVYMLAFLLFILSVFYMLAAGLHAVHMITSENVVHVPEKKSTDAEQKKEYDEMIAMNRAMNLIRNNYVYTSYECIRNSLFSLFLVMVIAVFPIGLINNGKGTGEISIHNNYYYSTQAMKSMNYGIDQSVVEDVIDSQAALGRNKGVFSVIDNENHMFIKYSIENGEVNVQLVEVYEP